MPKNSNLAAQADEILELAVENTKAVFADATTPPTARASAVSSAIRLFEILKDRDANDKDASEMTAEELAEAIRDAQAERAARSAHDEIES